MREHLRSRHVRPGYYHMSYDEETVTFCLYTLAGMMVGTHRYRPHAPKTPRNDEKYGRYWTYIQKGHIGVWGLETYWWRRDVLFVTEGVFDAVRIHNLGLPAVALLANDPKPFRPWLSCLNRHIVAVCDNDTAGKKLAKFGDSVITVQKEGADLGDLTDAEVEGLLWEWL